MKTVDQLLTNARNHLPKRMSPTAAFTAQKNGTLLIDIRGDEQLRRDGLIPGAIVIRRNVFEWRCDPHSKWHHAKITGVDQKVIVICNEGYQSSLAAYNLQQFGMKHATDMIGGFINWKKQRLPIIPYSKKRVGNE